MDKELIRDYLEQTAMKPPQAEALSRIFAEMVTKSDFAVLEARTSELEARLTGRMAELEARLTWRIIAIVGFFATVTSLLDVFIN